MNHLTTAQEEQLKNIGTYLRHCREEQEKSIEEIALKTFISLRSLKALEAGRCEDLPEPVFVQGFIRRYAETLNLDSTTLLQSFATEVVSPPSDSPDSQAEISESTPISRSRQPFLLYIGIGGIVVIGGLVYLLNQLLKPQLSIPTQESPTIEQQLTPNPPTVTSTPAPTVSDPNFPVQITVELKGESWVRVSIDGKTEFEGILMEEDSPKTWNAKNELTIRAGNAGAVWVSLNQTTAKPLGEMGEVQDVTFTPTQDW
ncbi:MAG: helix-turn-helix domain-containing protein [Coleofasciculus sp.]